MADQIRTYSRRVDCIILFILHSEVSGLINFANSTSQPSLGSRGKADRGCLHRSKVHWRGWERLSGVIGWMSAQLCTFLPA